MGLCTMTVCYIARQDSTVQYSTVQYNTIQYNTLQYNNTHHTKSQYNFQGKPQYAKVQE